MFSKFCKLLFVYFVLTFLFSDISSLKEPSTDLFRQQYEDVSIASGKFADYIGDTVIPYVDKKFDEADGDKSLAGNLLNKFNEKDESIKGVF